MSESERTVWVLAEFVGEGAWSGGGAGRGAESGSVSLGLLWLREHGGGAIFVALVFEGGADEGGK